MKQHVLGSDVLLWQDVAPLVGHDGARVNGLYDDCVAIVSCRDGIWLNMLLAPR